MVHNEKYKTVAIYSRVSMSDQDASRQLHELETSPSGSTLR